MKISLVSRGNSVTNVLYIYDIMGYKCLEELLTSLSHCQICTLIRLGLAP